MGGAGWFNEVRGEPPPCSLIICKLPEVSGLQMGISKLQRELNLLFSIHMNPWGATTSAKLRLINKIKAAIRIPGKQKAYDSGYTETIPSARPDLTSEHGDR